LAVGVVVPIPTLPPLVVSRLRSPLAILRAEVLFASVTPVGLLKVTVEPPIVRFPPTVVSPVPVVKLFEPVWVKLLFRIVLLERTILPVEVVPSVRLCLLLVPRTPVPVKKEALLPDPAEIEAVGTPPATLVKANFAELVACEPRSKSSVVFLSKIEPGCSLNGEPPLGTGRMPVMYCEPPARLSAAEVSVPVLSLCTTPVPRPVNWIVPLEIIPVAAAMLPAVFTWN